MRPLRKHRPARGAGGRLLLFNRVQRCVWRYAQAYAGTKRYQMRAHSLWRRHEKRPGAKLGKLRRVRAVYFCLLFQVFL